jgi:hypothetical protein
MNYKLLLLFAVLSGIVVSCSTKSSNAPKPLCDTACINDTLKYTVINPLKPEVKLTFSNCYPDTLLFTHNGLPNNRKIIFSEYTNKDVRINKSMFDCIIKDTSYFWLKFNDCNTSRGYLLKFSFDKKQSNRIITSAINSFDPKYKVENGLIAYHDYNFIYAELLETGKKTKIKLSDEKLPLDFDNTHAVIDSVNITRQKVYIKYMKNGESTVIEQNITLQ